MSSWFSIIHLSSCWSTVIDKNMLLNHSASKTLSNNYFHLFCDRDRAQNSQSLIRFSCFHFHLQFCIKWQNYYTHDVILLFNRIASLKYKISALIYFVLLVLKVKSSFYDQHLSNAIVVCVISVFYCFYNPFKKCVTLPFGENVNAIFSNLACVQSGWKIISNKITSIQFLHVANIFLWKTSPFIWTNQNYINTRLF